MVKMSTRVYSYFSQKLMELACSTCLELATGSFKKSLKVLIYLAKILVANSAKQRWKFRSFSKLQRKPENTRVGNKIEGKITKLLSPIQLIK